MFPMTKEIYLRLLNEKALHYETVFSNRGLNSLFIDGLLPQTQAQTRHFFFLNPRSKFYTVVRQDQAPGISVEVARWPATMALAIESSKETRFREEAGTLLIETSSSESESIRFEDAGSELLAFTHFYTPPLSRGKNPSAHFNSHPATLPLTPETATGPSDSMALSPTLVS